jgi:hypothetical protein
VNITLIHVARKRGLDGRRRRARRGEREWEFGRRGDDGLCGMM